MRGWPEWDGDCAIASRRLRWVYTWVKRVILLESIRVVIVVDGGPEARSLGCGLGLRPSQNWVTTRPLVQHQVKTNPELGWFHVPIGIYAADCRESGGNTVRWGAWKCRWL